MEFKHRQLPNKKMEQTNTCRYIIRDTESGTYIDSFESLEEVKKELKVYEKQDSIEKIDQKDFYEIYDNLLGEIIYLD
jgi:hypothetical protein